MGTTKRKNKFSFLEKYAIKENNGYAVVDRKLFVMIVTSAGEILSAKKVYCSYKEFLGFCLKTYEKIESVYFSKNHNEEFICKNIRAMMENS